MALVSLVDRSPTPHFMYFTGENTRVIGDSEKKNKVFCGLVSIVIWVIVDV